MKARVLGLLLLLGCGHRKTLDEANAEAVADGEKLCTISGCREIGACGRYEEYSELSRLFWEDSRSSVVYQESGCEDSFVNRLASERGRGKSDEIRSRYIKDGGR